MCLLKSLILGDSYRFARLCDVSERLGMMLGMPSAYPLRETHMFRPGEVETAAKDLHTHPREQWISVGLYHVRMKRRNPHNSFIRYDGRSGM